jgi:hypothetical protein
LAAAVTLSRRSLPGGVLSLSLPFPTQAANREDSTMGDAIFFSFVSSKKDRRAIPLSLRILFLVTAAPYYSS